MKRSMVILASFLALIAIALYAARFHADEDERR